MMFLQLLHELKGFGYGDLVEPGLRDVASRKALVEEFITGGYYNGNNMEVPIEVSVKEYK